ncbi:hypothetical protein LZD49_32135 [Dyadobacter sp. CY261]|uniref:hypothetical protein n=1 Tax=Dyadobacter sp. CY261 TaxID=2907203 RepID=UPI001F3E6C3A|nr:hypothetical protein [Dyadobacter sp. CY261]MCF0075177.1 hypothetical protein [Dyadobacter sp. CY261]
MKFALYLIGFWIGVFGACYGQENMISVAKPVFGLPGGSNELNFQSFSSRRKPVTDLWKTKNLRFAMHPDAGYVAPNQPPGNVVEILEKRTETTRFYIDADTPGKVFLQGSYGAMHYRRDGQWLIIDTRLENKGDGRIEASHQPEPVGFDINSRKSYIVTAAGKCFSMIGNCMAYPGRKSWSWPVQIGKITLPATMG